MGLLKKLLKEEKNELTRNLEGFITYRKAGDYDAWNNYQPKENVWTKKEEINVITFLLNYLFKSEASFEEDLKKFTENNSMQFKFFQIIHLFVMTELIVKLESDVEQKENNDQLLNFLEELNIHIFIRSAVPGP